MPVRLAQPYGGQLANTLYWGADQGTLRAVGIADDYIENASDFVEGGDRVVTTSTAIVSQNAITYRMNSATAQTLTLNPTGYWAKDVVLTIVQGLAGATTVVPAGGVVINGNAATTGQYKILQLFKGPGLTWTGVGG